MKKEIPKVFANRVNKAFKNNSSYSVTRSDDGYVLNNKNNIKKDVDTRNINQKIKDIFKSNNYIYKADVTIVMSDKSVQKRVIGVKSNQLITIDNELIPFSDIKDIYYS